MEWCEMGWVMRVGRNWVVWMVGERMLMEWDGIGRDGMGWEQMVKVLEDHCLLDMPFNYDLC